MRRAFVLLVIFIVTFVPARALARPPSGGLISVLANLQNISGAFSFIVTWSSNPTTPNTLFSDYDKAEAAILNLDSRDREAVLFWLQSHGRQKLYARGASDAQIGPQRFPIDTFVTAPTAPAKDPAAGWHKLPFIAGMLGPQPIVPITISSGFSMVKDDASSEVHCVSFKNVDTRTAVSITFGYQFLDAQRNVLTTLSSVRKGTFSSNIDIEGPADFATYLTALGGMGQPRSLADNCWRNDVGTAALALLQARYFTFRVTNVLYDDGSVWSAPDHDTAIPQ